VGVQEQVLGPLEDSEFDFGIRELVCLSSLECDREDAVVSGRDGEDVVP
jgi:hypothetical protein